MWLTSGSGLWAVFKVCKEGSKQDSKSSKSSTEAFETATSVGGLQSLVLFGCEKDAELWPHEITGIKFAELSAVT